tara:strand:+ start:561 stop:1046 length:486 start_codon:yes stop_codon:yes gene_type:complete
MKKLVTVLAIAALMTSCQKEDLTVSPPAYSGIEVFEPAHYHGQWFPSNIYDAGLDLSDVKYELCEVTNSVEVLVNISSIDIDFSTFTTTYTDGSVDVKSFDYEENYLVQEHADDSYFLEALNMTNFGEVENQEYEIMHPSCGYIGLTIYNTVTGRMIYLIR